MRECETRRSGVKRACVRGVYAIEIGMGFLKTLKVVREANMTGAMGGLKKLEQISVRVRGVGVHVLQPSSQTESLLLLPRARATENWGCHKSGSPRQIPICS